MHSPFLSTVVLDDHDHEHGTKQHHKLDGHKFKTLISLSSQICNLIDGFCNS